MLPWAQTNSPVNRTAAAGLLGGPVGTAGALLNYGLGNPLSKLGGQNTPYAGLSGTAGGISGTGFAKPGTVPLNTPVTGQNVQNSIQSQQALLTALQNQNGLGAQTNMLQRQQDLANALQGGIGNQQTALNNLNNVGAQFQNVANGTGPNPAQAMLNQATGQNVANQAALMAGQRGAGSNVGLMARQAAQQGAGTQQQSVGQGATMQANQQLGALGQMGNIYGQAANIGQQQVGNQLAANAAQSGMANQIAGQNIGALQNQQAAMMGGAYQQNANALQQQQGINNINAQLAGKQMQGQQGVAGGLLNGAGAIIGSFLAEGGEVQPMADGGTAMTTQDNGPPIAAANPYTIQPNGPMSSFGQYLKQWKENAQAGQPAQQQTPQSGPAALAQGMSSLTKGIGKASGANVTMNHGGMAEHGGDVKASSSAQKAVKPGNSYSNDKIKAVLSEGEVVIPRSIMQSKDPTRGAADFVAKVLARRR